MANKKRRLVIGEQEREHNADSPEYKIARQKTLALVRGYLKQQGIEIDAWCSVFDEVMVLIDDHLNKEQNLTKRSGIITAKMELLVKSAQALRDDT